MPRRTARVIWSGARARRTQGAAGAQAGRQLLSQGAALARNQTRQRMSRQGACWDNAVADRFFATLEYELLAHTMLPLHREAHVAVNDFIEHWYNGERQHSRLAR